MQCVEFVFYLGNLSITPRNGAPLHQAGYITRLCADANDEKERVWFREQVLALGAEYKVNATGTQL